MKELKGLSIAEVKQKKKLGLSNDTIDSYTPDTFLILRRNIFSLINVVVVPLLILLAVYQRYTDIFAFSTFIIINTVISILDEIRNKNQLEKLKSQFQQTALVIRDGEEHEIPSNEIVEGDYVKAKEGEGILSDGTILYENYLQIDESALNGESNYIRKEEGEKVLSGSFIVTGDCIYKVESVGKNNYLNKLGTEALKYAEKKSSMQRNGDKLIIFLVVASISLALLNFYATNGTSLSIAERVLGLTTIITLIIPQTLIFLFTLTFTISITKLYNKGVLVQKGGSIEELSNIDYICFDKTGTITTNDMSIDKTEYFNIKENDIGEFYNSVKAKIVGINKTQEIINKLYSKYKTAEVTDFDQVPFTSKNKYSLVTAKHEGKYKTIVFGAFSMLQNNVANDLISHIKTHVTKEENLGNRVLLGLMYESDDRLINTNNKGFDLTQKIESLISEKSNKAVVFTIEETLNPGIKKVLNDLTDQGIQIKIISGDSLNSVTRIMQKLELDTSKIIDLSEANESLSQLALEKNIFTRSKPEDKLTIIKSLQQSGAKVAMVGDGINDVLSLKAADVSIAMEGGSKIARDVADMVLLNNDYKKIPMIFYEGQNIIFNLKTTAKMFLVKSFLSIILAVFFTLNRQRIPIDPGTTLIFSFLGSSAPSYVIVFTRQKIENSVSFFKEVLLSAIPSSIVLATIVIVYYLMLILAGFDYVSINTSLVMLILSLSIVYSLYLVWDSKKLRNPFVLLFLYTLLMLVGVYETTLPLTNSRPFNENLILLIGIIIGTVLFAATTYLSIKPKKFIIKAVIFLIPFVATPIISIFPFQTYHSATGIPFENYLDILRFTIICAFLIFVVHFVPNTLIRYFKNK